MDSSGQTNRRGSYSSTADQEQAAEDPLRVLPDEKGGNGNALETRTSRIWLRDDGIVQVRVKRGVEIDLEDAEEIIEVIRTLSGGRRPMLLDYRWSHSLTLEARVRLFQLPVVTALAMLTWTHIARITCEFLLSTSTPPYPARIFTSEQEAVLWLKQGV